MMSTTAKEDGKKKSVYNEVNEALYETFQATQLPDRFPTDLPWPEWSDADLNSETWGTNIGKMKSVTSVTKIRIKSETEIISSHYSDPYPVCLPPDLEKHVDLWKRPHEVFPPESLVMYDSGSGDVSLKVPSERVSNCELFEIASDIFCILRLHSSMEIFPSENETPNYASNTKSQPWQPWHHIYGNCKAGRDQPHLPVVYPYGKYILRLCYLGVWRKFVIDDQIPCDSDGKCLLPVTQVTGELWPILLVKGILKISSLTQTSRFADMDLPIWSLFTGWIPVPFCLLNKSSEYIWRLIHCISPHFTLQDNHKRVSVEAKKEMSIPSKGTTKRTEEKKESEKHSSVDKEERPVLIIGELSSFPKEYTDLGDTCRVAILMTRDIPLTKAKRRKPIEKWKNIRWVRWAVNKGILPDEQILPPYRCLYQINFKERLKELVRIDEMSENRMFVLDELPEEEPETVQKGEPTSVSPLQWIDFFKFVRYLSGMLFLIKPSALLSKYRMTYLTMGSQNAGATFGAKNKAPTSNSDFPYYVMMPNIKTCGNEPPILYCESDAGIFIIFSIWVCPVSAVDSPFYLSAGQPDFLKVYHAALIVETHDWRSPRQNEIIAVTKTVGNACTSVFLNPGRHTLKMWLDTDSPFVVDVYSNAELAVGKGSKIQFLMSTEAKLVTGYINQISAAFLEFAQKFGKPNFGSSLFVFYTRIKPGNTTEPQYESKMCDFIETFLTCLLKVLKSLVTNDEEFPVYARVLQVLFINPNIYIPTTKRKQKTASILHPIPSRKSGEKEVAFEKEAEEVSLHEMLLKNWIPEEADKAVTIQKMYRGYRVRSLLRDQHPNSKQFKTLADRLQKICDIVFAVNKRDVEVARLIREIIAARPDLLTTFSFHKDISNVTVTEEYTGRIVGVEPKAWVPMMRFIFACHSSEPLPCAFYLSCNLEQYTVTVTDNDTCEEIFQLVNATCPHYYPRNRKGYTLFVYGWNEWETKTVNWKLEMIKTKYFLEIHPCNTSLESSKESSCHPYQPQSLCVQELRNFYVPNKRKKICQCLIKIRKNILVTIRLAMSYENARFRVRIYLRDGNSDSVTELDCGSTNTVIEAEAKNSAVILPSVFLDHYPNGDGRAKIDGDDRTVYVMEAHVLDHSWPLTKHEWGVVEPMRVNGETWHETGSATSMSQLKRLSMESRKKLVRPSKSLTATQKSMENPFWSLQVVTDFDPDPSNAMEIVEDRSYQETIKLMKQSWEEKDPGRRAKGRAIQREFLKFLYNAALESKRLQSSTDLDSNPNEFFELIKSFEGNGEPDSEESFEALLHEMRSFSYLLQDKSKTRYLVSPRILPWVPLEELVAKHYRGTEETDSRCSLGNPKQIPDENQEGEESATSRTSPEESNWTDLMKRMNSNRRILETHVVREYQMSRRLMDQAYQERATALERMKVFREKTDPKSKA